MLSIGLNLAVACSPVSLPCPNILAARRTSSAMALAAGRERCARMKSSVRCASNAICHADKLCPAAGTRDCGRMPVDQHSLKRQEGDWYEIEQPFPSRFTTRSCIRRPVRLPRSVPLSASNLHALRRPSIDSDQHSHIKRLLLAILLAAGTSPLSSLIQTCLGLVSSSSLS
jgi:hypothetical protein